MNKVKKVLTIKTKYGIFKCAFEPEKDMGGYAVEARGIQGAISWGKSLTEARRMIAQSVEGAVEARIIADAARRGAVRVNAQKKPVAVA